MGRVCGIKDVVLYRAEDRRYIGESENGPSEVLTVLPLPAVGAAVVTGVRSELPLERYL